MAISFWLRCSISISKPLLKHCIAPLSSVCLSVYTMSHTSRIGKVWFCPSLSDLGWDRKKRVADVLLHRNRPGGKLHVHPPLTGLSVITNLTNLTFLFAKLITPLSPIQRWISWRLRWLQTGTGICFWTELLRWKEGKMLICYSWQHNWEEVIGFLRGLLVVNVCLSLCLWHH